MLSTGCNYSKLKTNLRLAINRLKLLVKKKTELTQKARKEIADYLEKGKIERSKIRVEHIIREDYVVEAMEVLEMYCDLLLARFGIVQQMKTLDEGLAEAISSLIWAAPRLQTDVAELKVIADQLAVKYGKQFAIAARENSLNNVNEKLVHKLNIQAPRRILVEKYLIEIAKSHNVPYEPKAEILAVDETAISDSPLVDLDEFRIPEPTFVSVLSSTDNVMYPDSNYPAPDMPKPFNYPSPTAPSKPAEVPPPVPSIQSSGSYLGPDANPDEISFPFRSPAPSYESIFGPNASAPNALNSAGASNASSVTAAPAPSCKMFPVDTIPELPPVPNTVLSDHEPSDRTTQVDFEDLVKRFEELKKRN